jgi:hypothetical protein
MGCELAATSFLLLLLQKRAGITGVTIVQAPITSLGHTTGPTGLSNSRVSSLGITTVEAALSTGHIFGVNVGMTWWPPIDIIRIMLASVPRFLEWINSSITMRSS